MIDWFTRNGVAANLLMAVVVLAGLTTCYTIKLELFPQFDLDFVSISVPYPGAAPEEVESGIVSVIEERVEDLQGIKSLVSTASEGMGSVLIEVESGYRVGDMVDRVKVRMDAIDNFPEESEQPIVEEVLIKGDVISLAVYGNSDERTLKMWADSLREELTQIEGISQVSIGGVRDYEVSLNVSEQQLRKYGLSFDSVAAAVNRASIDLPGGSIQAEGGEWLLRTQQQAYVGPDFEQIVLLTREDGTRLTLGDVAEVDDGFTDDELLTFFNNRRAAVLNISSVGDQDVLDIAAKVKVFAQQVQLRMPEGMVVEPFRDFSFYLKGRLQMLIDNGLIGLLFVFIVLTLFLRPSLAFFVMLGIPVSFMGAMMLLPLLGVTINLSSLFGFILVLGIVVDDAIVVGESVFTHVQREGAGVQSSIRGAQAVAVPVTFAVLTTMVAFLPITVLPGFIGKFFFPIPVVVIFTLLWSLVQSKLVLPYHLSLCRFPAEPPKHILARGQRWLADGLENFVERVYRPTLRLAMRWRYATLALFVGALMICMGVLRGGQLRFVFMPEVPSDYIVARLVMPQGSSFANMERALAELETGLQAVVEEAEDEGWGNPFQNVVLTKGGQPFEGDGGPGGAGIIASGNHLGEVAVELVKNEDRVGGGEVEGLSAPNLADRWRDWVGEIAGVKELVFSADAAGATGSAVHVQVAGEDFEQLQELSLRIQERLHTYEGLFDIKDNYEGGKREIRLRVKPSAEALGVTTTDLARQVRQAFYGEEVQRIQRGRDDVRVMVRYPREERESLENLEQLRIRMAGGGEIPFYEVAEVEVGQGFPTITREEGRRVINITAEADKDVVDLKAIVQDLSADPVAELKAGQWWLIEQGWLEQPQEGFLTTLMQEYEGVTWKFKGEQQEQSETNSSLVVNALLVLFLIYVLMAIPFKSYVQPVIVMAIIPFGLIGAVVGHALCREDLSILSILGLIALAGVLVNDSLVLVDYINKQRRAGVDLMNAVWESGAARFRAILLTSLTTFVGLFPLLFESSLQAQFLIPMAISLSFGILFATVITLFLVPILYLVLEDIKRLLGIGHE